MVQVDDGDDRVELRQSIMGWVAAEEVRISKRWYEITYAYVHTRVYLFDFSKQQVFKQDKKKGRC